MFEALSGVDGVKWRKVVSAIKPSEVQHISNNRIMLHKNISEKIIKNTTHYEYEEIIVDKSDYALIMALEQQHQKIVKLEETLMTLTQSTLKALEQQQNKINVLQDTIVKVAQMQ